MSETLEPALPRELDERAEKLMRRLCDRGWTVSTAESCTGPAGDGCEEGLVHFAVATRTGRPQHRVEHFGAIGRGPVRVKAIEAMLEMLEKTLAEA